MLRRTVVLAGAVVAVLLWPPRETTHAVSRQPTSHRALIEDGLRAVPLIIEGPAPPSAVSVEGRPVPVLHLVPPGQPIALSMLLRLDATITPPAQWANVATRIDTALGHANVDGARPSAFSVSARPTGPMEFYRVVAERRWNYRDPALIPAADWTLSRTTFRHTRPVILIVADSMGRAGTLDDAALGYSTGDRVMHAPSMADFRKRVGEVQATVFLIAMPGARISGDIAKLASSTGGAARTLSTIAGLDAALDDVVSTLARQSVAYVRVGR